MNSTIILGIASILLAAVFWAQTDSFPAVAQRMPTLLIWLVVGLAVMMIIEEMIKRRMALRAAPGETVNDDDEVLPPINWPVVCVFGVAIVAYVALIPIIGYVIMTTLFVGGALIVARTMALSKAILVGVGTTAFVAAIFIWALNLPVPLLPFLK